MAGQGTELDDPRSGRQPDETAGNASPAEGPAVRHMRSTDLFGPAREVVIRHEHHVYRLKQTSRGGLILTK